MLKITVNVTVNQRTDCYRKYDGMRKKRMKSRFTFEFRAFMFEIKQTHDQCG